MKTPIPRKVADLVVGRADGHCEAMIIPAGCVGQAQHLHHRKLRSQGEEHTVGNLVHICHKCHSWIHKNPTEGIKLGFIVKAALDPEMVQVCRRGRWGVLHSSGVFEQSFDLGADIAPFFSVDWG